MLRIARWLLLIPLALILFLVGPLLTVATGAVTLGGDWRAASRNPVGLAPDPAATPEAVLQVYAARAFNWRGAFAVHSWIAVKPSDAPRYTVYEVIGWRSYHGLSALFANDRPPDSEWFGHQPDLLLDLRGKGVDTLIERVTQAAAGYPYANVYRAWPGPNSNTFVAYVARQVPELRLELPPTAIGKDYLGTASPLATTPSGTGIQFSLFGLLGVLVALEEGIEINLLGLTMGIDPLDLAIKLPGLGNLSLSATTQDAIGSSSSLADGLTAAPGDAIVQPGRTATRSDREPPPTPPHPAGGPPRRAAESCRAGPAFASIGAVPEHPLELCRALEDLLPSMAARGAVGDGRTLA